MNHLQSLLQKSVSKHIKIWHLVGLIALTWLVPALLPDEFIQRNIQLFLIAWAGLYLVVAHLMKKATRNTTVDTILIERFMLLASAVVPIVGGIVHGVRHGFDTMLLIGLAACILFAAMFGIGIILHLRGAHKFYHGVKKDKLFED